MKDKANCPKDNNTKLLSDCYEGDCSNEQFDKCFMFWGILNIKDEE